MSSKSNLGDEKSASPQKIRRDLILYLLKNYGDFQTKEIAKILGHEPRTIRRSLKKLEKAGKVEADKLGKGYIWSFREEDKHRMYF